MPLLTSAERRALRAKAHHLTPVVIIGQHGLTPAVQHEIDVALLAHELIKLRVHSDDRGAREVLGAAICAALACENVQHLGKMLVLWRANPDKTTGRAKSAASKAPLRKTARKSTGRAQGESRDDTSSRRRLRDAKGKAAPAAALPYFSRRGAGRFVANTPDATSTGKAPAGTVRPSPADTPRRSPADTRRRSPADDGRKPPADSARWSPKDSPRESAAGARRSPTGAARDFPPASTRRSPAAGGRKPASTAVRDTRVSSPKKPRAARPSAVSPPRTPAAKSARRKRQG